MSQKHSLQARLTGSPSPDRRSEKWSKQSNDEGSQVVGRRLARVITPRFIRIARYSPILMIVLAVIIGFAVSRDSVRSNPVMDQDGTQVIVLSTNVGLQAVPSGSLVGPVESILISSSAVASDIAAPVSYLFIGKSIFPSFYDTPASAVLNVPSVSGSQNGRSAQVLESLVRYMSTNTVLSRSWVNVLRTSNSLPTAAGTQDLSFIPALVAGGKVDGQNADNYAVRLARSSDYRVVDLYVQAVEWNDGQTVEIAHDVNASAHALTYHSLVESLGVSRFGVMGNIVGDSVGAGTITGIVDYPVSGNGVISDLLRSTATVLIVATIVMVIKRAYGSPSSDEKWRMSKGFGAPNFAGGFTAG